jgi:DNA-binding CsgD family transcriptional regulator
MDTPTFNKEATNIWQKATSDATPEQLNLELDLYKKLLSFFQVGDYFYCVYNLRDFILDVVHPNTFEILMDNIHPDDRAWFLNFENKIGEFLAGLPVQKLMNYKARYDFRIKKKDGTYVRLLHQSIIIEHDEKGMVLRTLGLATDITHLKPEGTPLLSIIGLDGEPSYINVDVKKVFAVSKEFLSKREKQVLLLIMEGKLSKEIGEILNIGKQTVDTHRNNMIERNHLRNTSELIAKAIKQGWV